MSQDLAPARKSSGLTILWDVVIAPRAAFAALREQPTWLWAFIITGILGMIGALLAIPASQHMSAAMFQQMAQTDPRIAQMTPDQQQRALHIQQTVQQYIWLAYPVFVLIAALVTGLVMLILNAISGGDGNFKRFFALAMNVALINWGISYLLVGIVAALRGPESFSSARDMVALLPSLAWLAPGAPVKLAVFLGSIGLFTIWSMCLLSFGMQQTSRIKPAVAWIGAVVIVFASAAIGSAFAQ